MKKLILSIAIVSIAAVNLFASSMVDSNLPNYKKVKGVSGNLKSVGSDTMNNLMTLWAEKFMSYYPNVKIEIEGKGSSTAPAALISGTSHFGPMSREMKAKEMDDFEKKYGYKPTGLKTSIDMLAVYVNKDNPIQCLSLEEVDAIFSKTRKRGYQKDIVTWGDLGLTGEWANKPISLYGRNSASGTYGYFKEHVFKNGDYKDTVKEQPGSSSVVQGVTSDRYAIGYSGIGYKTAGVKAVALSEKKGGKCINADAAHAYTGEYPLARFLYIYVNYKPGSKLDPLRAEFLRLVFSKQGQEVVVKDGYFPITNKVAEAELAKVGLK
ncbi:MULTISPECIES: PstS family phosphate ABC transporter substrate-binding protein [Calditerrivibrio]|uniref:Phosphate-binding protein n=1 Tax=Calditerrivibrio nitroreducens TaxID=477976 RepID=A0A2J6WP39_9BACT|nr:MAG: phosphate-binding protein [Calditerrivibrio nitroreducens]